MKLKDNSNEISILKLAAKYFFIVSIRARDKSSVIDYFNWIYDKIDSNQEFAAWFLTLFTN